MEYRTNDMDLVSGKNTPIYTLIEAMLQDAFLTNYKIALGIIDELLPVEGDNKALYARCKIAIQRQIRVNSDGTPVFDDYEPILAKVIRFGNNSQSISTNIVKNQLCLLFFTDRPFSNVWNEEIDEETQLLNTLPLTDYRAHDMNDAICLPFAHDVSLTDHTVITDNVTINGDTFINSVGEEGGNLTVSGNLTVGGNLTVSGNITAAHIEAEDGFTGTKTGQGISVTFNKGICTG